VRSEGAVGRGPWASWSFSKSRKEHFGTRFSSTRSCEKAARRLLLPPTPQRRRSKPRFKAGLSPKADSSPFAHPCFQKCCLPQVFSRQFNSEWVCTRRYLCPFTRLHVYSYLPEEKKSMHRNKEKLMTGWRSTYWITGTGTCRMSSCNGTEPSSAAKSHVSQRRIRGQVKL